MHAAVEKGTLPVGGTALLKASLALGSPTPFGSRSSMQTIKAMPAANLDQGLDVSIIRRASTRPTRTILNGVEEPSVIMGTPSTSLKRALRMSFVSYALCSILFYLFNAPAPAPQNSTTRSIQYERVFKRHMYTPMQGNERRSVENDDS